MDNPLAAVGYPPNCLAVWSAYRSIFLFLLFGTALAVTVVCMGVAHSPQAALLQAILEKSTGHWTNAITAQTARFI